MTIEGIGSSDGANPSRYAVGRESDPQCLVVDLDEMRPPRARSTTPVAFHRRQHL